MPKINRELRLRGARRFEETNSSSRPHTRNALTKFSVLYGFGVVTGETFFSPKSNKTRILYNLGQNFHSPRLRLCGALPFAFRSSVVQIPLENREIRASRTLFHGFPRG